MTEPAIRDELDARVRTLEAERLRPVPPALPIRRAVELLALDDPDPDAAARLAELTACLDDDTLDEYYGGCR